MWKFSLTLTWAPLSLCLVCNLGAIRGRFKASFWFGVVPRCCFLHLKREGRQVTGEPSPAKFFGLVILSVNVNTVRIEIKTPYS